MMTLHQENLAYASLDIYQMVVMVLYIRYSADNFDIMTYDMLVQFLYKACTILFKMNNPTNYATT